MGAFFSATDDANENASQFYGVWGKIKDKEPQFAFRYCSGDAKVKCCPSILFDWPMVTERTTIEVTADIEGFEPESYVEETKTIFKGPFPKIDYPSDWMGQHTKGYVAATKSYGNFTWGANKNKSSKSKVGKRSIGGARRWDDFDPWEEEYCQNYYQRDFFNYLDYEDEEYEEHEGVHDVFEKGMEHARIQEFINFTEEDPFVRESCQHDVDDITSSYKEFGFDRVIEASIDASKSI